MLKVYRSTSTTKIKYPLGPKKCLTDYNKNGIHLGTASGSYRNI